SAQVQRQQTRNRVLGIGSQAVIALISRRKRRVSLRDDVHLAREPPAFVAAVGDERASVLRGREARQQQSHHEDDWSSAHRSPCSNGRKTAAGERAALPEGQWPV